MYNPAFASLVHSQVCQLKIRLCSARVSASHELFSPRLHVDFSPPRSEIREFLLPLELPRLRSSDMCRFEYDNVIVVVGAAVDREVEDVG